MKLRLFLNLWLWLKTPLANSKNIHFFLSRIENQTLLEMPMPTLFSNARSSEQRYLAYRNVGYGNGSAGRKRFNSSLEN